MRNLICIYLIFCPWLLFGQVTSSDGLDIFVQDEGSGDTTLLFIHGWNLNHSFFQYQVNEFRNHYRVVVPDLPGYGKSGKTRERWSMEQYGRDIRSIIHQLDLKNVVLVAHSMGGNIALEAFKIDPSGIVAIIGVDNFKEVGATPDSTMQEQMDGFYAMLEENYPVNVRMAVEGFMFHPESPPGPKEEILDAYASVDPEIAIPVVRAAFTESDQEADQLENVDVPFALISSTNIPFNEEMFLQHYHGPHFHNYEIQKTGHFPMYEDPESFNRVLHLALSEF